MARNEAQSMASELTVVRQVVMKASYKVDVVQRQVGDIQKQVMGMQEQMNRMESLLQGLVSSQARVTEQATGRNAANLRQTEEPRNLQDSVQPGELEMEVTRRIDDLRQANLNSTQEFRSNVTPEGVHDDDTVRQFLEQFPLPKLLGALQSEDDVPRMDETVAACLDKVFSSRHGALLLPRYGAFIQAGLLTNSKNIRQLACKAVLHLLDKAGDSAAAVETFVQHNLYPLLINCLIEGDEAISAIVLDAIKRLAEIPKRIDIIFPLDGQGSVQLDKVAAQSSSMARVCILSLVAKLFTVSSCIATATRGSNILSLFKDKIKDRRDMLKTLSVLEVLCELVEHPHSNIFLLKTNLLEIIIDVINDSSVDSIIRAKAALISGRLLSSADAFTTIEQSYVTNLLLAIDKILRMEETQNNDEIESVLKALGLIGTTTQGARLLLINPSNVVMYVVETSFDRHDRGLRSTGLLWNLPPWPGFCAMVCNRFAQHSDYEVLENFHSVKQYNHSVLDYTDKFEELMAVYKSESMKTRHEVGEERNMLQMAEAVAEVLPNARHRFCFWHILKKLQENVDRMHEKEAIPLRFKEVVYDTVTLTDFEKEWVARVEQYKLKDNEWFSGMYSCRKQWAPGYVNHSFWAGTSTIRKVEKPDPNFDGVVTTKITLLVFLEQYEATLKGKLKREAYEDLRSYYSRHTLLSGLPFEEQLVELYTVPMFQAFQDEIKQLMHVICKKVERSGNSITYMDSELIQGKKVDYTVVYNNADKDVWCICRSFPSRGILCSHALAVLKQENVLMLPSKYILNRWRKEFRILHASASSSSVASERELGIYDDLYACGHEYLEDVIDIGAREPELKEFVLSVMKEAKDKLLRPDHTQQGDQRVDVNMAVASQVRALDSTTTALIHGDRRVEMKMPSPHLMQGEGRIDMNMMKMCTYLDHYVSIPYLL